MASFSGRANRWLESGLFDVEFYGALRGQRFEDVGAAVEDFVEHGMGQRLSPHPFLDVLSLPTDVRRAFRGGKVKEVLTHLAGVDGRARPTGPLAGLDETSPVRTHLLDVARRIGHGSTDLRAAEPAPNDWQAAARLSRVPGRTSVVVLADARPALRAVASVLRNTDDLDLEVLVVDRDLPAQVSLGLHAWCCGQFGPPSDEDWGWLWSGSDQARVGIIRFSRGDEAGATDAAITRSTGDVVVLLDSLAEVRRGWLPAVRAPLVDADVAGVEALLLRSDDTIAAAGSSVLDGSANPTERLVGHQKDDALRLEGQRLAAPSGQALGLRAEDVIAARGCGSAAGSPDPWLDLCARVLERRPGGFRLAPTSLVTSHRSNELPSPARGPDELVVTARRRAEPTQLRWSIKLPSPAGRFGDGWGDTYYGDALAAALRRHGQDVVTCRREGHEAGPTELDDVSVSLRGLFPIPPMPGQRNVLWVISHPDEVDPSEFEGYDVVCAASTAWSAEMTTRAGREVVPLLQASEFRPPEYGREARTGEQSVVFVGTNAGKRERPLVWQAVEAGVPLSIYGRGWEELPEGIWKGDHVANWRLPELYHRHGIVLSDHWPDMSRGGFIANRVFDAVASGARVITDDVTGIHDVFDPDDVVVVHTPEQIRTAVTDLNARPLDVCPPRPELSFDDRAQTLLELVARS